MASESIDVVKKLMPLEGKRVRAETVEGTSRAGIFTRVRWHEINVRGVKTFYPKELILDSDESDPIPFDRVIAIDLADFV